MPALTQLTDLIGKWQGENHLWLYPGDPVHLSESLAEISPVFQGQFSELCYTWAEGRKSQEGRMLLGQMPDSETIQAVWFDTWHMANQFMVCQGGVDAGGVVQVKGAYAAPPGPDWGWQITIEPQGKDQFRFLMHNITPEGESFLAVETIYTRRS